MLFDLGDGVVVDTESSEKNLSPGIKNDNPLDTALKDGYPSDAQARGGSYDQEDDRERENPDPNKGKGDSANPSDGKEDQKAKSKTPAIDKFGRDLSALAKEGLLDPVIGRKDVLERALQVLGRRTKNNPMLIGEPGVGKTAIVEGLAQMLPEKRIVVLDLGLMVAGTKYRGEFEERIKAVMKEAKKDRNILLFIDEFHTLIGAGGSGEGTMDAANILKPALSRGEIQAIGATTLGEYRKYVEKDAALERRFQPIILDPPSTEETKAILLGLREKYEKHHGVRFTDEALKAIPDLAARYISSRFQPDKSIDVMDELGAMINVARQKPSPELVEVRDNLELASKRRQKAEVDGNLTEAGTLRKEEKRLTAEKDRLETEARERLKTVAVVGVNDVRACISKMTGIPVPMENSAAGHQALELKAKLLEDVKGQSHAVDAVVRAVMRSAAGMSDPKRPKGVFCFLGPTGVGKTHLAKSLAKHHLHNEDAFIQLDMSEFMEKHSTSKIIGAPPGYIGFDESSGQLAEKVRRMPHVVVLLDEVEKAHPEVLNLFLQVFEEGYLTDSTGRKVSFRNAIIVMTSNIGSQKEEKVGRVGFGAAKDEQNPPKPETIPAEKLDEVPPEVLAYFRPELINRVDRWVPFLKLSQEVKREIVRNEIEPLSQRLSSKGYELAIGEEVVDYILEKVRTEVDPEDQYGARPIRKAVERYMEDPLSEALLKFAAEGAEKKLGIKIVAVKVEGDNLSFDLVGTPVLQAVASEAPSLA